MIPNSEQYKKALSSYSFVVEVNPITFDAPLVGTQIATNNFCEIYGKKKLRLFFPNGDCSKFVEILTQLTAHDRLEIKVFN